MTILLWKVLDNRVVNRCLAPALWLAGLIAGAILLPDGSGLQAAAVFNAFIAAIFLICRFIAALAAPSRSSK